MKANHEDLMLEISSALEQIQKVNEMIRFHQSFEEPDENALHNFNRLRDDFNKISFLYTRSVIVL